MKVIGAGLPRTGTLTQKIGLGPLAESAARHNGQVRREVPPDRLLEWNVAEGWAPLCAFLELPVPDVPLPHVNDAEAFAAMVVDSSLRALGEWWQSARPAELAAA